ncbi:MAG: DUF721 domain-containing protein [Ignavibacteria bacterium]|nr:DUF721 domain-containing protein [Ignavibacteria bacterium]
MSTEFRSMKDIVQEIIKKYNLDKLLEEEELKEKFEEIVGSQIAQQAKIKSFENGKLTLEVESPVWKNEILLLREKIKEKINTTFGKEIVQQIIIV